MIASATIRPGTVLLLLSMGPLLAGCGSFSDFNLKDQQWFAGTGGRFLNTQSLSIEQPPLTPARAVTPDQLISAEGACPGLAPSEAQALAGDQPSAAPGGKVALGLPECEVARGIGVPDSVNLSAGEGGGRVAVLTYLRGPRAGIYRFVDGRLASVERSPEPPPEPKRQAKPKKRAT